MPYAAITYRIHPGHEDEVAKIFAGFQRVDTPVFSDEAGEAAGKLLGTAVFVKDDVLVRVIHYEGELSDVARHMARQRGVHLLEEKLAPHLAYQRDTASPEAFGAYFRDATMKCVSQLTIDTHPRGSTQQTGGTPAAAAPWDFLRLGTAFCGAKVLLTALELDLFTALASQPATEPQIRQRLGLHPRGTKDWLDCLAGLGVLERDGELYRCGKGAAAHLVPGRPGYVGGFLERANQLLYPAWGRFTEALRTGAPQTTAEQEEPYNVMCGDPAQLRAFLGMMDTMNGPLGPELARCVPWQDYSSVVDVGGARGNLLAAIVREHPHLAATVFDLPPVEPFFHEHMKRAELAGKLRFAAGDFFSGPLPEAEVLVMGHVLHDWSADERRLLAKKAFDAVRPGGVLLVYDPMLDEQDPGLTNLIISLDLLLTTRGGAEYTPAQCRSWLEEAGFTIERAQRLGFGDTLVIGRKNR
jgi:SAM-dependent methyltransferase